MAPRAAAPAAFPDNDDLLSEFLLRLPPQPSSLPRASLVCKRWHRLVTDPGFRRRFRAHHRNPPLIGVFDDREGFPVFRSVMGPPDVIPAERFRLPVGHEDLCILGCRHGCVLLFNWMQKEVILWDPSTGEHRIVSIPSDVVDGEATHISGGAVLCAAAGNRGHVHDGISSCPFMVVLVGVTSKNKRMFVLSYSSETGLWNDLAAAAPFWYYDVIGPGVLVGNALYWIVYDEGYVIIEIDLDRHSLAVIDGPPGSDDPSISWQILRTGDGGFGFAILSPESLQMWVRTGCTTTGFAKWVLRKTEKLHNILGIQSETEVSGAWIMGYAEDIHVILLWVDFHVYMLQHDSLQSKKLWEARYTFPYHPYTSIYASGL